MKLRFEALATMWAKDHEVTKAVLDAMIVKSQISQAVEGSGKTPVQKKDLHGRGGKVRQHQQPDDHN
ncbi:hypothetical protein D3M71_09490 [Erwinia billingiae]|nr:hypothetical protein [Erwinia billingiae]